MVSQSKWEFSLLREYGKVRGMQKGFQVEGTVQERRKAQRWERMLGEAGAHDVQNMGFMSGGSR